MPIYTKKEDTYAQATGFAQNPFIRTMWSLDRSLRILAFLRNKLFCYVFCRSNLLITTTSPRLLAVKTASKLPLFGHFWPRTPGSLEPVCVSIWQRHRSSNRFVWNIWLQETSLKMIFASEAVTAFVLIIFPLSILLSQSNAQFRPSSDAELFMSRT